MSLMTRSALSTYGTAGTEELAPYAFALALVGGVFLLTLGVLRLGFISNFIPHSVMSAFMTASGFIIIMSQMGTLFKLTITTSEDFFVQFSDLIHKLNGAQALTAGIGIAGTAIGLAYYLLKKRWKWLTFVPIPFMVTAISIILSWKLDLNGKNVKVVGTIPSGFPNFSKPSFGDSVGSIIGHGVLIGFVCYVETISLGQFYGPLNGHTVVPNQEMIALGMGNLLGAFTSSYPTGGSYARTPVNAEAGARSQVAELITLVLTMIAMNTLTGVLYYVPNTILSSIVIVSGVACWDFKSLVGLWKRNKIETLVWASTFFGTLILSVQCGIAVGVGVSIILILFPIAFPDTFVLGRLSGLKAYRAVKIFPEALVHPSISVVRIDSPLCYLNATFVTKFFKDLMTKSHYPVKVTLFFAFSQFQFR